MNIKELEEQLYQADPFIVEAYAVMSSSELQEKLLSLYTQLNATPTESRTTVTALRDSIDIIEKMLEHRALSSNDGGGVSLI